MMKMAKWSVLLVLSFFAFEVIALKEGETGVCTTVLSTRRSRKVWFTRFTNKKCGIRKCIVKSSAMKPYTVTSKQAICCGGFEYNAESDACAPICSMRCVGGTCVAPNTCRCDPPAYPHPDHPNTCVQPTCEPPCLNGTCISNNTCQCNHDSELFNAYTCLPKCELGFTRNPDSTCSPKCDPSCVNGKCVAPNVCSCAEGYILKNNTCELKCDCVNGNCSAGTSSCVCFEGYTSANSTHCIPKCDHCINGFCIQPNVCNCSEGYILKGNICEPRCSDCVNGKCVAPNTCACFKGYAAVNETHCIPKCDNCINGACTAPNVCTCSKGYTLKENMICKPKCNGCINGNCLAPETCICHDGYALNGSICVPQCSDCVNGVCTAPDICTCSPGYTLKNMVCEPKCQACINGHCTAPNTCTCFEGHVAVNNTHCNPRCDGCINGVCIAPNICSCLAGYVMNNNSICEPRCYGCVNSNCVAPNTCECINGYNPINSTHCVSKCKDGYSYVNGSCEPVCETPCVNGYCIKPNVCACKEGHLKNKTNPFVCFNPCKGPCEWKCSDFEGCLCSLNHPVEQRMTRRCHPASKKSICYTTNTVVIQKEEVVCCIEYYYNGTSCVLDCPYGFLPTPNNSACYPECIPGYSTNFSDPALNCVNDCKLNCINGTCSDTNECICHSGYKKNGLYECTPHCDDCYEGVCKSPGECVCNKGYIRENNTCKPVCDHCEHGTCVRPNICDCVLGYINDGGMSKCKPLCMECTNGTCVSPHVCECDPGFASDPDKRRCHPICEEGCANATCVAPNTCECAEGFTKSDVSGGCKPVCERCSGECVAPGVCVPSCEECGGACRKNESCMCANGTMCIDMRMKLGRMKALPIVNCNDCAGTCTDGICKCPNDTQCEDFQREAAVVGSNLTIAGIHVTWMLGGGILILLLILIGVVSRQIYLKHTYNQKNQGHDKDTAYGSVVYTVPNTLKAPESMPYQDDDEEVDVPNPTEIGLLSNKDYVERL